MNLPFADCITKTVDGNGNIYFQSGTEELLFIAENSNYILYERDKDGKFTIANSGAVYSKAYVDSSAIYGQVQ